MSKGENVGKVGSPGWQPTDKTRSAGKTPPVNEPLPMELAEPSAEQESLDVWLDRFKGAYQEVAAEREAARLAAPYTQPNGDTSGSFSPEQIAGFISQIEAEGK